MRSNLRNLCCTAIGQASAFSLVSNDVKTVTQEEIEAIKETAMLLRGTLNEMMKIIQEEDSKNTCNKVQP